MKKFKFFICILSLSFIILFLSIITYNIDKNRIINSMDPLFAIKTMTLKDGGSIEFTGLGYKIIKWNILCDDGFYTGYEISKIPNLKNIYDGPSVDLKYI